MKVLLISLGCDKTRVDSEYMLGAMAAHGYTFTDDEEEAEAAVVNTCCFIADATAESIRTILPLCERRKDGSLKALIVAGCLVERFREEIGKDLPEVDAVLGTTEFAKIADTLDHILQRTDKVKTAKGPARIPANGSGSAYLRIADGCDKHCTYCIIPKLRGPYRSVPMETLVNEARELSANGVKELVLVAQETTRYGMDLYGGKSLTTLLKMLLKEMPDIAWFRLMYCYPEEIDDDLIDLIAAEERILPYLDIPVQSGSDKILKRMGRKTDAAAIRALVTKLRERIPEICIRTTLITGFPGETAADHNDTLALVRELRFDRLGVFPYSREAGTPAYRMRDQINEPLKTRRRNQIMRLQQEIAFKKAASRKGERMRAIIEGYLPEEDIYIARTYLDAPEVDGLLFIDGIRKEKMSGDLVEVKITGASGYDLTGNYLGDIG